MSTSDDLRYVYNASGPLIQQQLDNAEAFADLREFCRSRGIDWGQLKALRKAQIEDDRDGEGESKRVDKIIAKADYATAYADMLGLGSNMNKHKNTRSSSEATRTRAPRETAPVEPTPAIASPVSGPSPAEPTGTVPRLEDRDSPDGGGELTEAIPPFLARDKDNRVPDTRP